MKMVIAFPMKTTISLLTKTTTAAPMKTTIAAIATAIFLAAAATSHAQVFATYGPWTWAGAEISSDMTLDTRGDPSALWVGAEFTTTGSITPVLGTPDGSYDITITYNSVILELSSASGVVDSEPVQMQLGPIEFNFTLSIDLDVLTTYEIPPLLPVTRINSYGLTLPLPLNDTETFTVAWIESSTPIMTGTLKNAELNAEAHLAGWIAVPEPAHFALLSGISLLAVAGWRRLSGASASGALRGNWKSRGRKSR